MPIRLYLSILLVSILVPVVIAYFLFSQSKLNEVSIWYSYLPHLNAILNSTTAALLILGLAFIKSKDRLRHKITMITAFVLGGLFLISYLIYHSSVPSTVFGDLNHDGKLGAREEESLGVLRIVYLSLLLTHIGLAFVVVPLVLMALYHALRENYELHKKIVKYAYPIWLYVSVTGVLVYFMIRPYYS